MKGIRQRRHVCWAPKSTVVTALLTLVAGLSPALAAPGQAIPQGPAPLAPSGDSLAASGAFPGSGWPLLVVILDGLDWEWLERYALAADTPHLREFVSRSARAAYNPLAGPREGVAAYLSAALGFRVEASEPATLATGARARRVFQRRTGVAPPPLEGGYFLLELPRLSAEARASGSFAPLGWLGDALRQAGLRMALLGDEAWVAPPDAGRVAFSGPVAWAHLTSPLGLAGLLAMDTQGTVAPVHSLSVEDPASPGSLRTRWSDLPGLLGSLAGSCGPGCSGPHGARLLAIVASGDLWRLLREEPELAPTARELHHRALAARLDALVGWWHADPFWGKGSLLLFGATAPSLDGRDGRLLTAMLWRGPWEARALYSATARRDGFVTAVDLAPTLAGMAGAPVPQGVVGRPLTLSGPAPEVPALREFARTRAVIWSGRFRVMSGLITAQVLVLAAGLALAATRRFRSGARLVAGWSEPAKLGLWRLAVAWTAAIPLVLLHPWVAAPPLADLGGPVWAVAAATLGAVAVAASASCAGRLLGVSATSVIGALTAGVLAADLVLRLDLVTRSFMGFDLIGGARLYGMGNEHVGLLIGSSLMAAAEAGERWRKARWPLTIGILSLAWLVASPVLGANVGGSLATAAAVGACAAGWHADCRPKLKAALGRAAMGAALAASVLLAAALQDTSASASQHTHLALTVEAAREVGNEYVLSVARRKLALNWRLLRYSLYSRIMFVAMLVVMAAFWAPAGGLLRALERRPRLRVALEASALGAAVALVANDSGVTAAAGALLAPAAWVLELALNQTRALDAATASAEQDQPLRPA